MSDISRSRDMIRSIFTRDKPGTSDPAVAEALADAELQFGDTVPTRFSPCPLPSERRRTPMKLLGQDEPDRPAADRYEAE